MKRSSEHYNGPMLDRLAGFRPHLPAAVLLLFSCGSGTFAGGATGDWAVTGHLVLLAFVATCGRLWPDFLGLGRRGHWLLLAVAIALAASYGLSPVPRAGRLGLILLPAFLLVPSAVAHCWSTRERRRLGLLSLSAVYAAVAAGSLLAWWRFGTPGTSLPLGHHNLLAAWLLVLGPLAIVPWRDGGAGRVVAGLAAVLGLTSLLATSSLGAAVAVGVVAVCTAAKSRRSLLLLLVAGLLSIPQLPRVAKILSAADTSVAARISYLEAGWRGARPFGWGPGAASWTLSEHLRPVPGLHPPDQVVADLHCLPLQIAYEIGWSGLLLCCGVVLVFALRRREAVDPRLRRMALGGLGAMAAISLFGLPLAVAALPLAAMIAIGAALAAEAPVPERAGGRVAAFVAAVVMAGFALPLDLAHLAYDRAIASEGRARLRELRRAVELDPGFPLYRARLAWLESEGRPDPALARQALGAARDARGLAALWLAAGLRGQQAGEPWSREALLQACRLSPLGAMAPFFLTLGEGDAWLRQWAGRAVLAEPMLLAAVAWRRREPLVSAAVEELERLDGLDASWRQALSALQLDRAEGGGSIRRLVLEIDGDLPTSVSLFAFRRQPWPAYLAEVELDARVLSRIQLLPATAVRATPPTVFQAPRCGLGGASIE